MGGAAKALNPKNILRGAAAAASMGTSELLQKRPLGLINNPTGFGMFGDQVGPDPSKPSDPFTLDQAQVDADKAAITGLGDKQFAEMNSFNHSDQGNREAARQQLAAALTKQGQDVFSQGLPATEEMLNSQHLLNGSGLGQEIARQQGNLASNIANTVGVQGLNDINRSSDIDLSALQAKQGTGQSALSRGFSLSDFVKQANVAKSIGAQAAPQVSNGKGQTGTLLSGLGATAPLIGALKGFGKGGPAGAAAGGLSGLI